MPAQSVNNAPRTAGALTSVSAGDFERICRDTGLSSRLEQILVTTDEQVLSCGRAGDPELADELAHRVRSTWDDETRTAQIQFVQLSTHEEPLLLFTRPVADFLLTLAAQVETPINFLSRSADLLGACLPDGVNGTSKDEWEADPAGTLAIAWRPVKPMSRAMRQAAMLSARNLAQETGCHLTFVGVASDHVHLVMHCPPHRTSSWVACQFKSRIQEDIQRQFDASIDLWAKGFLASPSAEPLAGEELLFYLGSAY